jgi:hypothetical protein
MKLPRRAATRAREGSGDGRSIRQAEIHPGLTSPRCRIGEFSRRRRNRVTAAALTASTQRSSLSERAEGHIDPAFEARLRETPAPCGAGDVKHDRNGPRSQANRRAISLTIQAGEAEHEGA